MPRVACIVGSPSAASRTAFVAAHVGARLADAGCEVDTVAVRELPAEELLHGNIEAPAIARAVAAVEGASGVVVATPIYKASFSGLLKVFLDLLPQHGLEGKAVLPLATGGGTAHVLAMDYGLRPVLMALGAEHVEPSYVVLDKGMRKTETGDLALEDDTRAKLDELAARFARYLAR